MAPGTVCEQSAVGCEQKRLRGAPAPRMPSEAVLWRLGFAALQLCEQPCSLRGHSPWLEHPQGGLSPWWMDPAHPPTNSSPDCCLNKRPQPF